MNRTVFEQQRRARLLHAAGVKEKHRLQEIRMRCKRLQEELDALSASAKTFLDQAAALGDEVASLEVMPSAKPGSRTQASIDAMFTYTAYCVSRHDTARSAADKAAQDSAPVFAKLEEAVSEAAGSAGRERRLELRSEMSARFAVSSRRALENSRITEILALKKVTDLRRVSANG